ncbi:MAG: cytochrome c oxidase subunit 3 [Alphaproteobacteria bacterium]|nr:cytochrome c oxidase subunit 3 [Alphaproteobacteria bacterium]
MSAASASSGAGHDEVFDEHHWRSLGVDNVKLAFWTFLGSDCFFFASLIGTYMYYRGQSLVGPYPLDVFSVEVTSISTFVLLMSSFTMALAVLFSKTNRRGATVAMLLATAAMGATFVAFQMYEFAHFFHEGLTLQGNLFGSTFYTLTGFHGTHVALGVLWLLASTFWYVKGWIRGDEGIAIEVAGLYWHFVDIVWIVIFTVVYLMEFVR